MEVDSDYRDGGGYVVYGSGDEVGAVVVYGSSDDDDAVVIYGSGGGIWIRIRSGGG